MVNTSVRLFIFFVLSLCTPILYAPYSLDDTHAFHHSWLLSFISKGDVQGLNRYLIRHPNIDLNSWSARLATFPTDNGERTIIMQQFELPIVAAAQAGQSDIIRCLKARGADVNAQSGDRTALSATIDARQDDTVLTLLQEDVDVTQPLTAARLSPLHLAAQVGSGGTVTQLLKHTSIKRMINVPDDAGLAPIAHAAMHGNRDALVALLEHPDTDVNVRNERDHGQTPLMYGAQLGFVDIVFRLLGDKRSVYSLTDYRGECAYDHARRALESARDELPSSDSSDSESGDDQMRSDTQYDVELLSEVKKMQDVVDLLGSPEKVAIFARNWQEQMLIERARGQFTKPAGRHQRSSGVPSLSLPKPPYAIQLDDKGNPCGPLDANLARELFNRGLTGLSPRLRELEKNMQRIEERILPHADS